MIGQKHLIETIDNLIDSKKFPKFMILCGAIGSGKKTITKYIAKRLKANHYLIPDIKVETIREMLTDAYKVMSTTLYVISDCDTMSPASKNSLLKATEEPPNNAYFIMTVTDLNNVLPTIKSRANVQKMDIYMPNEILSYAESKYSADIQNITVKEMILDICDVPYDVDMLIKSKPLEFESYVKLVVDNIAEVSGANSFKIGDKLALKDDDKYDLGLFWKVFMKECVRRAFNDDKAKYLQGVTITSSYITDLRYQGVNKQMMFDNWILDIRRAWM